MAARRKARGLSLFAHRPTPSSAASCATRLFESMPVQALLDAAWLLRELGCGWRIHRRGLLVLI